MVGLMIPILAKELNLDIDVQHAMEIANVHDLAEYVRKQDFDSVDLELNPSKKNLKDQEQQKVMDSIKERFREALFEPTIYKEENVEQALKEFKSRIQEIKIERSTNKGREELELEKLNQILKEKRKAELKIQNNRDLQEGNNE